MSTTTSIRLRRSAAVLVVAGGLTAAATAPASAATTQQGLVNVSLTNTTIQVPIGVAANVCNVAVNVLANATVNNAAPCMATADSTATAAPAPAGNTRQNGLINISATNTTVQLPIGIAANVCNVAANVLVTQVGNGAAACDAVGTPTAG